MDQRPIGVFDSGIGGLTVLHALMERLPQESFVYLGDTARVPYGTKGVATIRSFALQAARYLEARGVKRLVIACNTASSHAIELLERECKVPVEGVVVPGVEAALRVTQGHVGVIGTPATIASDRYGELLRAQRPELIIDNQHCPLFVPLAEEGWVDDAIALSVAERYLSPLRRKGVDTLILGCTHYPLLKGVIAKVMGPEVSLVDSALVLADSVARDLEATDALSAGPGGFELVVSDMPQRFAEISRRFLDAVVPEVHLVDLDLEHAREQELEARREDPAGKETP
jgi:glutamate racemase